MKLNIVNIVDPDNGYYALLLRIQRGVVDLFWVKCFAVWYLLSRESKESKILHCTWPVL